jgi:GTP-binding protein
MSQINAHYIISNSKAEACPPPNQPEYAFIGRSNVGKSSLINMLAGQKHLAKTSGRPGKTQLINHFLFENSWYLVDLPGYGYAKVSKTERSSWGKMIEDYLLSRKNLMCVFVLVDIRHDPQKIDLEFMNWLADNSVPFCLIFTKADKLSNSKVDQHVAFYKKQLKRLFEPLPQYLISSATEGRGQQEILQFIHELNEEFQNFA